MFFSITVVPSAAAPVETVSPIGQEIDRFLVEVQTSRAPLLAFSSVVVFSCSASSASLPVSFSAEKVRNFSGLAPLSVGTSTSAKALLSSMLWLSLLWR
jgi:hypothetical protein